jgi:hypothetical protein
MAGCVIHEIITTDISAFVGLGFAKLVVRELVAAVYGEQGRAGTGPAEERNLFPG